MAFICDFSVTQVYQNKIITVRDLSNYGDHPGVEKQDFISRKVYLTRATTLEEEVYDFPFIDPVDSVQDTLDIPMPFDQAFEIRLELVNPNPVPGDVYQREASAALTGLIDRCRLTALANLNPSSMSKGHEARDYYLISAFKDAAESRGAQGDIEEAQRLLDFVWDMCKCKCKWPSI